MKEDVKLVVVIDFFPLSWLKKNHIIVFLLLYNC